MSLMVSMLQRLAEARRYNNHPHRIQEQIVELPVTLAIWAQVSQPVALSPCHSITWHPQMSQMHVQCMCGNSDDQNWVNGIQVHGNVIKNGHCNSDTYQGNAAQNYHGNATSSGQEQMDMILWVQRSSIDTHTWGRVRVQGYPGLYGPFHL